MDDRERAYAELCRRMAAVRDRDPAKLRFYWGSLFVAVLCDVGGLGWADVEPLWQRWHDGIADWRPPSSGVQRRARYHRSRRSHRGGRGGRGRRRRGWWREPPFPLPECAPETAP